MEHVVKERIQAVVCAGKGPKELLEGVGYFLGTVLVDVTPEKENYRFGDNQRKYNFFYGVTYEMNFFYYLINLLFRY